MQNQTYESNFLFPRRMLFFHANRSALLIRGLVFSFLGLIGLFRPIGSLAAVTVILGVILLLDAMGALFLTFACRPPSRFFLAGSGILSILIGILLAVAPFAGLAAFSTIVAVLLLISGIEMLVLVFGLRVPGLNNPGKTNKN